MADTVFNIAKGRVNELVRRVDTNDPANSAIVVVPVDVGAVTDATVQDFDTLSAVLAGGVTERSTANWNRKVLTDTATALPAPDDTNNRQDSGALGALTWDPGPTSGNITDLIFCYDSDTTAGTDADLVPLVMLDCTVTADGSVVEVTPNAAGIFRAT